MRGLFRQWIAQHLYWLLTFKSISCRLPPVGDPTGIWKFVPILPWAHCPSCWRRFSSLPDPNLNPNSIEGRETIECGFNIGPGRKSSHRRHRKFPYCRSNKNSTQHLKLQMESLPDPTFHRILGLRKRVRPSIRKWLGPVLSALSLKSALELGLGKILGRFHSRVQTGHFFPLVAV